MPNFTKIHLITALFVMLSLESYALNVVVMESQSYHSAQTMDINWYNASLNVGHATTMEEYPFLDDACNLKHTDILIISSALLTLTNQQLINVKEFVRLGGQLYIQSEYLYTHSGNITFRQLVQELGGSFDWKGQGSGQQVPMHILNPVKDVYNTLNQLNYFWYGTYGEGDHTIESFLEFQGKDYGFIFTSDNPVAGKIMTISDQDWIRNFSNPLLLENIIKYLEAQVPTGLLPAVSITSSAEESCAGEIVTFDAEILNYHPGVALQWMINGQAVNGQTDVQFQTAGLQDGDVVECVLQVEKLCFMHQHVSNPVLMAVILPIATPTLEISTIRREYCQGDVATFLAEPTPPLGLDSIRYQWLLNGNPIAGATQELFNSSTLLNNDAISCELSYYNTCDGDVSVFSESISLTIIDVLDPQIVFTASQTTICEGTNVTFLIEGTDLGDSPSYQWIIDGQPISANGPQLDLATLTNGQQVSAIVTSSVPCATNNEIIAQPIEITVYPTLTPTASIQADQTEICLGEMARFEVIGNHLDMNPTYEWTVDGTITGTDSPEFISSTLSDGAQVSCRVNVSGNCLTAYELTPDAITMKVNNLVTPHLEINANTERACTGSAVTFTATGENWGTTPVFQWALNGTPVTGNQATYTVDSYQAGDAISLVVTSSERCAMTDTIAAEAEPITTSELQLEVVDVLPEHCGQKDGFVEVAVDGGFAPVTLAWNTGENTSFLETVAAGTYELEVTDAAGCTASVQAQVVAQAAPQILEVITSPALCEAPTGTAKVVLGTDENYTYHWTFPNGSTNSNTDQEITLPGGTYEIAVEDEFGCISTEQFEVEVFSPITVDLGEDLLIKLGEEIEIEPLVNLIGEMSFSWEAEGQLPCTDCATLEAQPLDDVVYTVVATSDKGCTATDEVRVKVIPNETVYIPNVFSPNGDGANDYFTVFGGSNLQNISRMQVFDRWGNAMYDNTNLTPNAETEGWDGSFRGQMLDQGVYVYVLELQFIDGSQTVVTGDISIF